MELSSDNRNGARTRALVWHGSDRLAVEPRSNLQADDGHVVLNVSVAGICGSDLHVLRGHPGRRRPPLVLGHEAVGTVDGREGRFALFPLMYCGTCTSCRRGEENLCKERGLIGLDRDGVFADQAVVREDALVLLPEAVDNRRGALVEPLATGYSALEMQGVTSADTVLVIGCGPIGLLTVYAARARAARVLALEPVSSRRQLAARLGAVVVSGPDELASEEIDLVVDAVGVERSWSIAVSSVRNGGAVVVVGLGQAAGPMAVGELVRRGVTVRGHYAYRRADFVSALGLLAERELDLDWLTSVSLEEGADAFRRLIAEPESVTKVLIDMAS